MRDRRPAKRLLALSFLFLGFLIMLHQFMNWGKWFQLEDVHHESFVLACFATALGIYIGAGIGKDERSEQTETIQQPNSDSSRQWLQSSR